MSKHSLKDLKKALKQNASSQPIPKSTLAAKTCTQTSSQNTNKKSDNDTSKQHEHDQSTNQSIDSIREFKQLFADATPLKSSGNYATEAIQRQKKTNAKRVLKKLSPYFIDSHSDDYAIFNEDFTGYYKSGYQYKKIQRYLSKAGPKAHLSLDIHGLTQSEAIEYILLAIKEALDDGFDCLKIIHGKGRHSENQQSILHPITLETLAKHRHTIGAIGANPNDGGHGATYVLLKSKLIKDA